MTGVHAWERRNKRALFGWVAYRCLACREYAFVRPDKTGNSWQAEPTCPKGGDE